MKIILLASLMLLSGASVAKADCYYDGQPAETGSRIGQLVCQSNGTWQITEKWGVVFGGDRDIENAQYEISRANYYKEFQSATLFLRDGWYRSIVVFDTEQDASRELPKIYQTLRSGSYLVNLNSWCPNWESNKKTWQPENSYNYQTIQYYQCYE